MNSVVLIGRLTAEVKSGHTQSDKTWAKFTVAVDRMGEGADFIPVTVWGKSAENCAKYLGKGSQVGIEGSIQTGSYKNKDGNNVYTTDVVAHRVEFIGSKKSNESSEEPHETFSSDHDESAFEEAMEDIPF